MAISKSRYKKTLKIVPPNDTESPQKQAEEPATPFDAKAGEASEASPIKKNGRGRPVGKNAKSFWDSVNEITAEEWQSKRFYIYAYLWEPFGNVKTEGEPGYLRKFYQAIDPEFILQEWGSGKYFLRLKHRAPTDRTDHDVDSLTFEVMNPNFPPKLPRALWEKDPRNEKWLKLLPKEEKPKTEAETLQILNAMFDFQDRLNARNEREEPERPGTNEILDTAVKLIELTKPKEEAKAIDPWTTAEKILTMRSENPMVTMLSAQLDSMRAEQVKDRDAMRALQQSLYDAKIKELEGRLERQTAPKGLLEQAKELAQVFGMSPEDLFKRFMGGGSDGAAAPVKSKMSGTMEFISDLVPKILESPLAGAAAMWLQAKTAQPAQPAPRPVITHQPQQPPANGATQGPTADNRDELIQFVNLIVTPTLVDCMKKDESGGDLAEWLWAGGHKQKLAEMQTITHPLMPGQKGPPVIITMYQQAGQLWSGFLAPRREQFEQFVKEFCEWKAPADAEATGEVDNIQAGGPDELPIDLDAVKGNNSHDARHPV